jgi:hypothetical protein
LRRLKKTIKRKIGTKVGQFCMLINNQYLNQLDMCDKTEKESNTAPVEKKIAWLKMRLSELRVLKDNVDAHPDKQISTTDPDSRLMKTTAMKRRVCYNIQSAVDCK